MSRTWKAVWCVLVAVITLVLAQRVSEYYGMDHDWRGIVWGAVCGTVAYRTGHRIWTGRWWPRKTWGGL